MVLPLESVLAKMSLFKLDNSSFKNKRPKVPTPTPSRPLRIYKVTQSTVKGLEKPLKFTPGKFYNFMVTGAGMDNKSPISGDVRWVPMYWSTRQESVSGTFSAFTVNSVFASSEFVARLESYIF